MHQYSKLPDQFYPIRDTNSEILMIIKLIDEIGVLYDNHKHNWPIHLDNDIKQAHHNFVESLNKVIDAKIEKLKDYLNG